MIHFYKILYTVWAWLLFQSFLFAQYPVVDLRDLNTDALYTRSFSVSESTPVYIDAIGAMRKSKQKRDWYPMVAYAWILNAGTREVIWSMNPDNVSRMWDSPNVEFKGALTLKSGDYEVYYSTIGQRIVKISRSDGQWEGFVKNFIKVFIDDEDFYEFRDEWRLRIISKDEHQSRFTTKQSSEGKSAVVSLTGARDSDYLEKGFTLEKPMELRVYCNGEGADGCMYDFGWITDDKTAQRVWEMTYDITRHGGGAYKNRVADSRIKLPPGNYIAAYITDNTHSSNEWNMQPPFDPTRWGLTITLTDESLRPYVHDYKKAQKQEILAIIRMGDQQYRAETFELKQPVELFISALGEGRQNAMYDYGWITNEATGERVWEMRYEKTRSAGGSPKNRLCEEAIRLPAGRYKAHYTTDGSHSYEDWNEDPPFQPARWGITISLMNNSDAKHVGKYNEDEDETILARITRVREDAYITKEFTLKKNTKVRVICLGEGKGRRMYDYGWIKNTGSRQIVWEMTYNASEHAGGGRKNRIFDGTILLEAGTYEVTYVSDDSHNFGDWNTDPPAQPDMWGITVKRAE